MNATKKATLRAALKAALPVMVGYLFLGFGFGVLLREAGYGVLWAAVMSLVIYAGSGQYVGVGLLATGAGFLSALLTTVAVNARHIFYSISMLKTYQKAGKEKPYLIFALTDETYSLLCSGETPPGTDPRLFRLLVSLFNHSFWILGGMLGNFTGAVLPFDLSGFDFSMTALFVAAFASQWKHSRDHLPALTGIGCSLLCLLIFGAEHFLIPAMLLITAALLAVQKLRDRKGGAAHAD